ncbi:MAG: aspartate dehydrogenase [Lachnospiraceae bacterium]|nr:aspartate dehydrogenase [Lachnospiraceae bacterium]
MHFHFGKEKTIQKEEYDRKNKIPVIRASICTGEQVAGFKDLRTGQFEEIMLIASEADKTAFLERYGIEPSELKKVW